MKTKRVKNHLDEQLYQVQLRMEHIKEDVQKGEIDPELGVSILAGLTIEVGFIRDDLKPERVCWRKPWYRCRR